MPKQQPKSTKWEEAVEDVPSVFSDEAERAAAEALGEPEEVAADDKDQDEDQQDEEDADAKR